MLFIEVFITFAIAMAVTGLFAVLLKKRGPWRNIWAFFFAIFLISWAVSLWMVSAGPVIYGVPWLMILIIAVTVGLFLAALTPPKNPPSEEAEARREKQIKKADRMFDVFLSLFVFVLALIIFFGYWGAARAW